VATKGQVKFKKIKKMLRKCAEGHAIEEKKHTMWVRYRGKKFHLPQGQHGKKTEIEMGHIRGLVSQLGIDPGCAEQYLPQLR